MDIFNLPKLIEQGVYDVMMWILVYPLTVVRMIFRPRQTLAFVRTESAVGRENAFSGAMHPTLFLFITMVLGSVVAPDDEKQVQQLTGSRLGELIFSSWTNTIGFSMVVFCLVPLTGAVLLDLLTPGPVTRQTMRIPFEQQCYIGAPSTLLLFMSAGWGAVLGGAGIMILLAATGIWVVAAEYFFFRDGGPTTRGRALMLALATLLIGCTLILIAILILALATFGTAGMA